MCASRADAHLRLTCEIALGWIQNVRIKIGCAPTESTGFVTKAIQIITLAILPRTRGYEWISLTLSRFAQQRKATIKGMPKIKHR